MSNISYRFPAMIRYWQSAFRDRVQQLLGRGGDQISFFCNVCGGTAVAQLARVTREEATCRCGSSVRLRSLVHVLTLELFGKSLTIGDIPYRPDLTGVDMSGAANYADRLAKRLGYTNTYLHKEPHLDITEPEQKWLSRCDFVISSDVFEHVAPPVSRAFDNVLRLLKPGGLFVLTVPYAKTGTTVEHFPDLHNYRIERRGTRRVLINNTDDDRLQEFENLVFHGGEGETLEMRVFSESGVLEELRQAGFADIRIHDESCPEFGILWPQQWSLPISARRPKI